MVKVGGENPWEAGHSKEVQQGQSSLEEELKDTAGIKSAEDGGEDGGAGSALLRKFSF